MSRASFRILLSLATVALLVPALPAVADSDGFDVREGVAEVGDPTPEVRFRGRGWGHGIGMSQYGAFARAKDGHSRGQILRAYYQDTQLQTRDTSQGIGVGLRQEVTTSSGGVDITPHPDGEQEVTWHGSDEDRSVEFTQPAGETWWVCAYGSETRVQDTECLSDEWQTIEKFGTLDVIIDIDHDGTVLETSDPGGEFKWGTHRIIRPGDERTLTTVQRVGSIETYLKGIAEVPDWWGKDDVGGMAALQVQAIAARGFALTRNRQSHECVCDILNGTLDQVYRGWAKEKNSPNWVRAVETTSNEDNTRGEVIAHDDGIIPAFYSSSNGGRSENNEDVWGGTALPYTRSVDDPYSLADSNPYRSWTARTSNQRVAEALFDGLEVLEQIRITSSTEGGSPKEIAYRGRDGDGIEISGTFIGKVAAGPSMRTALNSGVEVVRADGSAGVKSLPSAQFRSVGFEPFVDDDGTTHEYATVWAHEAGIARGRTPTRFDPTGKVTRGQMASFIYRAFAIPKGAEGQFSDVDGDNPHREAIDALADAGVARGFDDDTYRPHEAVTRAQMATFLVRAIGLAEVEPDGRFDDVADDHTHASAIHAIADEGITVGCVADGSRYCPEASVTRGEMGTFLHRAVQDDR